MTTAQATALPSPTRVGLSRGRIELRQFFRQREQVIFTFTFPAFILVLLASIFNGTYPDGVSVGQVFSASMIGAGIVATSFLNMGVGVALDREDGTLKRLHGTPVTATSYFLGKIVLVAVASLAEVVLLLAVGMALFDVTLPTDPGRWVTFAWVFLLTVVSCSLLGIAISSIARGAQSAAAVTNVPYVALLFMSGVYITLDALPEWMLRVGSLFPIKWAAQGFRSVFLPDSMAVQEAAGSWEHGTTALALGAWCVVGLLLCLVTFRWTNRRG
ncbi:ABC transporter permease [Actinophytocola xanthii]|uniref:Transport permease protein n=1 Tax=Actinophytocola xanthii TaxID=1912961 RepID=A0A1Q8CTR2_9PSEU|nr:ABC transporter permease [Actinophytocola xanthii]OLF17747.1 ABC transporter [Actinophytocola xanthii]